jgi:[protein-PII] uridylyltransferase
MCDLDALLRDAPAVRCEKVDGDVRVTVVARDRPGLLATLAGALTVCGLDVLSANLFGTSDGLALDVFRAADPFGRVGDDDDRVRTTIERALAGEIDMGSEIEERRRSYPSRNARPGGVHVVVDPAASETDTVVEVHADDAVGLLYRLASVFAALGLDVRVAKVSTLGRRVVDSFYVHDESGAKLDDADAVEHLRAELVARLGAEAAD